MTTAASRDWFWVALLAPALWAVGNHIDKYLLDRDFRSKGMGPLLVFSSLIGLVAAGVILLVRPGVLSIAPGHAALVVLNGALYVLSLVPYYLALQRDEASVVVPLFQTTAVFSYAFGLLVLGEQLTPEQLAAAGLILGGSVLLTLELHSEQTRFKAEVFLLMMAASVINALNWLLFKFVAVQEDFWRTSFWEYVGFLCVAVCVLLFMGPVRRDFLEVLRENRGRTLALVALNETVSLGAKTATNAASLAAPLALISTVHGFQPFFVLLYGVLMTLLAPGHLRENLTRRALLQKATAIALTVWGTCLLGRS